MARATSDHVFNATIWDVIVDPLYQVSLLNNLSMFSQENVEIPSLHYWLIMKSILACLAIDPLKFHFASYEWREKWHETPTHPSHSIVSNM